MRAEEKVEELLSEYEHRKNKVHGLKELGYNPWPEFKRGSHSSTSAVKEILDYPGEERAFSVTGRLILKRDHGKTFFGQLQDVYGKVQIYLKLTNLGDAQFDLFVKMIDVGDILWVKGTGFLTKTSEPTINVLEFSLLSKCLHPLAEKYHGLVDIEQRYRQRYLDLICNPETKERFMKRSKIVTKIRQFLIDRDFLEVETPMLHPIPGGAAARPFVTHHNAYDMPLYMRIAPELYLKRLTVGGLDRVFEINRNFRNEGISTRHNPEFTMLEFYMAYGDYKDGIALVQDLLKAAALEVSSSGTLEYNGNILNFSQPFAIYDMIESLHVFGGLTASQVSAENIDKALNDIQRSDAVNRSYGEKIAILFEELVEAKLIQPTFITGFPIETSPLAKQDAKNPKFAARFELFVCGMEISNGYTELNDPFDQAERFNQQLQSKESGNDEAHNFDQDYVTALEYGLPPTVGVGIGIDRLVMLLTNTPTIKDVILFPTLRPKN